MTAIRVIFDGKVFVPQEPVTMPEQSEAFVLIEGADPAAQAALDAATRAYYSKSAGDEDDEAWADLTSRDSRQAWDED